LNMCLCGLELDGSMHDVLKCNQTSCKTQWYHLMCVELEQKPRNWICAACEASGKRCRNKSYYIKLLYLDMCLIMYIGRFSLEA
ncbi:hypothetical protein BYT27DRAFT_7116750, partial [Phlegmacium glaucopus]